MNTGIRTSIPRNKAATPGNDNAGTDVTDLSNVTEEKSVVEVACVPAFPAVWM
jgi:hypothetical protein